MVRSSKKSISNIELTSELNDSTMSVDQPVTGVKIVAIGDIVSKVEGQESVDSGEDEADIGFKDMDSNAAPNIYVGKRNFIHQLMDVALLMANVSQLKSLLTIDTEDKYFYILMLFICASIVLQVVFTVCMLVIWSIERKLQEHLTETPKEDHPNDENRRILAERLDKFGNVLVLLIIVSNVFITGFGVEAHSFVESGQPEAVATYVLLANGTKIKV